MRFLITGGAGFIGSNLAERLLAEGHAVTVIDDLSGGKAEFLTQCHRSAAFEFVREDLLNVDALCDVVAGHDVVFHLAANSNIPEGRRRSDIDLRLGTLATYNVLEAMRRTGVEQILFSSSSVVYGEPEIIPTPETYGPLFPISLYGASKLACEGLISAFCHNYGMRACIYRFANICGPHGTHGVMVDFITRLQSDSQRLNILGDGHQAKPYLHVSDCVDGMIHIWRHATDPLSFFNLGCEGATSTRAIACAIVEAMEVGPVAFEFTGGQRGWPGDVPQVRLDCSKLAKHGWRASMTSDEAVQRAAVELVRELTCKQLS